MNERTVDPLVVSPDGRLLAVAEVFHPSVWLYETASGDLIASLPGHASMITDLAFSPDGRRLVSVNYDETGLVWDVTLPALGAIPALKASEVRLPEAWDLLAGSAQQGYATMTVLAAAPAEAILLLREKLHPKRIPTNADLDRIIRQLDCETFANRDRASAELRPIRVQCRGRHQGPIFGHLVRGGSQTPVELRRRV